MANDLFSGLGGLMKGLSGFMPQDDPKVQLMTAQSEVSELKKQETEVYAEIGRQAVANSGIDSFGELSGKLRLVQSNLEAAQKKLDQLTAAQQKASSEKEALEAAYRCPDCDKLNPEGSKFCQECGTKLPGKTKCFCSSCGANLAPGTRFCGECGAKQEV